MAEYESIHGTRVRYLTSDPTLTDSSTEGQVWYNSTSGTNKSLVQLKAWSSGNNLNTARRASGAMGTQDAGAIAGGQAAPAYVNSTEEYSGYAWTAGGNLNTTRAFVNNGTVGTQTAGLTFGGESNPPNSDLGATEEYDGSSWTSNPTNLNTARRDLGGAGIQTAALAFGGTSSPTDVTESYNGSSWTTVNSLNTGRASLVGAGTQTAALAIGGPSTVVESWNGSSWTNGPSLNFQLDGGAGASGTQTNSLTFGGRKPPGTTLVSSSEQYDGNTWVTTPSMGTARRELMGMGTAQAGLATGGFTPPSFSAATEEYNSNLTSGTRAAWSAGGNLSTARYALAGAGTQTAGLAFGGYSGTAMVPTAEEYNGSSWTNGGNMGTARYRLAGNGTQTSALATRGFAPSPVSQTNITEEYDGSSWTGGGNNVITGSSSCSTGTQTAGLNWGGAPNLSSSQEYNGSSWTAGNTLNTGRSGSGGAGTQTSGLAFGNTTDTETYNGTSWTSVNSLSNSALSGNGALQTAAIAVAGPGVTETWDGTNWTSTGVSVAVPRGDGIFVVGTTAAALKFGGNPPVTNSTEEWTSSTLATTASTLTTS